jgi:hypothetical protein
MRQFLLILLLFLTGLTHAQQAKADAMIQRKNEQVCTCLQIEKPDMKQRFKKCMNTYYSDRDIDSISTWTGKKKNNPQTPFARLSSHFSPMTTRLEISEALMKSCPKAERIIVDTIKDEFIEKVSQEVCNTITEDKKKFADFWDVYPTEILKVVLENKNEFYKIVYLENYLETRETTMPEGDKVMAAMNAVQSAIGKNLQATCKHYNKLYQKMRKS